jgi:hypothetical protein
MFENYSYKKKFIALILIFCMLSVAAYRRSFKGLIEVYAENKELKELSNNIKSKTDNIDDLRNKVYQYDKFLGNQNVSNDVIQQEIIAFSSSHKGISIHELETTHIFEKENYRVLTNQLDVIGNINELLKLTYDFETKFNFSRVISVNFYVKKKSNSSEELHLKIIFQNYENNK